MAYILDSGATLRLLAADPADPFVRWIEAKGIRPYIDGTVLAQTRLAIRTAPRADATTRAGYERRLESLMEALRSGREPRAAFFAPFSLGASEILADLLGLVPITQLGPLDIVPAAIAVERSFALVAAEDAAAYQAVAEALPPELGVLRILSADAPGS